MISPIFGQRAKKNIRQSPMQELEASPRSGLYVLVRPKQEVVNIEIKRELPVHAEDKWSWDSSQNLKLYSRLHLQAG